MAKIDLKHAYRSVPIPPTNYQASGYMWRFFGGTILTVIFVTLAFHSVLKALLKSFIF